MPPSPLSLNTAIVASPDNAGTSDGASSPRRRQRSWLHEFLVAPFKDIDDRVRVAR